MRKSVDDHKEEIITNLITTRQSILDEIKKLAPEQVDEPCIGAWSVKDLIAHLVGWDFTNLQAVQEILSDRRPTFFQSYDKDWRTYNAKLVALYRRETIQNAFSEVEESHAKLIAFLQSLPARELMDAKSPHEQGRPVTVRSLLNAEARDERIHAEQVRAFFYHGKDQVYLAPTV